VSERDVEARAGEIRKPRRRLRPAWFRTGPSLPLRFGNLAADFQQVLERELEAGRGFLWLPVLFSIGIAGYFVLPREPSAIALVAVSAALIGGAVAARRRIGTGRALLVLATIVAGTTAMKLRTDLVAAPRVPRETTATVTGWVAAREATPKGGSRIYLRVAGMERVAPDRLPVTLRITTRGKAPIAVGDAISLVARVQPPSGPALPGGYDFALAAFYAGIGGIGFAYGNPKAADLGPPPFDIRLMAPLAHLRETVRQRIVEALPGERGAIAAALVMGDQGGVSDETQDDMRASGLGHVLSISGLHMALLAGGTFFFIRMLLALSSGLALRHPIKKWAALGALAAATFYFGLSGGGVATDRSYIMIVIMFLAILADRRAVTLRNVALAAIAILVFYPESVLSVSFQMSFAATIALVAGYELFVRRAEKRLADVKFGLDIAGGLWRKATGLVLTSALAGAATTPFAIYHFQRAAPLGLIANVIASIPIDFLIMTMVPVTVLAMPFGLESLPLGVMGWGIDWMTFVARKMTEWSEGLDGVPMIPTLALLLFVAGFLWLMLWQERWRLAGLAPMLLALPVALSGSMPDVLVAADGKSAAVRGADGHYRILGKGDNFITATWLRADADTRETGDPALKEGVRCDSLGCVTRLGDGRIVALSQSVSALSDDCTRASVVISPHVAPRSCGDKAMVIDRKVIAQGGSVALTRTAGDAFRITTAYPPLRRPFMPPAAAQ
jgi:competence protein ComEC